MDSVQETKQKEQSMEHNKEQEIVNQEEISVMEKVVKVDMVITQKEKDRSSYLTMLGNIASDLDTLLTDLCHVNKEQVGKEDIPCTTGTLHSADTLGKDSFFSSAGNTSRRQGDAISSNHSLVSLSDNDRNDCDSVDSGHDGRCRSGPSPLVFDPYHFGSQGHQHSSSLTSRVEVSPSMEELRPISTVERLIKTNSIWLLATMSRAGAVHILKDRETGNFLVRKSSQPNSLAISVQSRLSGHSTVDHYLIEGTSYGFRLQGSAHFFHSIPALVAYYVENIDEIPYHLKLPTAVQQAKSTRELASLDMLGQDFWVSPLSRKSPSPELMAGLLHKSCSEPINIQQPAHQASGHKEQLTHNTVPSKSASDFSHFMRTQIEMEKYFEQHIHDQSSENFVPTSGSNAFVHNHNDSCNDSVNSNLVPHTAHAVATHPPAATVISKTFHAMSQQTCTSYSSKQIVESGMVSDLSATSSLNPPQFTSSVSHIKRLASEDSWIMASSPVSQGQHPFPSSQVVQNEDVYRSNPNNEPVAPDEHVVLVQKHLQHQHSNQSQVSRGAISLPNESQHLSSEEVSKDRAWTHPRPVAPKAKSNLYFTTNLGLLEIPENSYFTSNLSDKLSDYEDIWRNSCCESDVDRSNTKMIHDPRAVLDAKVNNRNKSNVKEGKKKVLRKTSKDSPPAHRLVPVTRDSVTGGTTGLTALEQARMIAGSTSEDESPLPIAHVKGIQRMESMFEEEPVSASPATTMTTTTTCSAMTKSFVSERNLGSLQTGRHSPHQVKFVTSHSLDFTPEHVPESHQQVTNSNFATIRNVSPLSPKDPGASKCVFTTTMSVIMSESASSEHSANVKKGNDKKSVSKKIPSPLGRLSRLKSSSESSLATVSSPLYAEPVDAVKLRDKQGKAINIQVRRRSAPSGPNLLLKDKTGKAQPVKVSQNPQLDTIFSPDAQNNQPSDTKFSFEETNLKSHSKISHVNSNVGRSQSMRTPYEIAQLQRKSSWKDRLNRLKLGTKVLTRNLAPPSTVSVKKNWAGHEHGQDSSSATANKDEVTSSELSPTTSNLSPGKFPLDNVVHRASCFSESSTVQDLISCAHPELSVRPIAPVTGKSNNKVGSAPPSEYDNLMIYRASTHSSQGTVYSPPWETSKANKFIRDTPTPPSSTHNLPPAMDFHERIERWQQANSSYHGTAIANENPVSSASSFHQMHIESQRQRSPPYLQTQQLLQHQQQLRMEDTNGNKGLTSTPQSPVETHHHLSTSSLQQQQQQHMHEEKQQHSVNTVSQVKQQKEQNKKKKNRLSRQDSGSKTPVTPSSPVSVTILNTTTTTNNTHMGSIDMTDSHHRLSSQCPDVVNCHNTPLYSINSSPKDVQGHVIAEDDILFGGELSHVSDDLRQRMRPVLNNENTSVSQFSGKTPGAKIREYIFKLSGDHQTIFGSTIENFIQCTMESQETNPKYVMRNTRQFMTGIKNYLVKHGEGELEDLIERERNKLGSNEILNIDAIIEQALHVCVLKPLKYHVYRLFVEKYSKNGALELLSRNIKYARTKSAQDLGVKPGLRLPQSTDMEVIKHYLDQMQRSYSPLQKLQNLLKATSTIYHCVQGKHHQFPSRGPSSLGADDFLPMLIYVIVHCGLVSAEIEADFMWGLLQPSLLTGEGGYYLTTLSSAVLILKNFQDTHQLAPAQMEGRLPTISDMQGFLRIAIPDELRDSITWKTLPVRPNMTTRDVCAMVAHKFKVTNPQDYGLFLLCDGLESQMADADCPQIIKGDSLASGKSCCFAFKRLDANIAWPKNMKHSPITVTDSF